MATIESSRLDQELSLPAFLNDPYPLYHRLRAVDPVHWSDAWDCWLLTRYDDVTTALRDSNRFSSVGTTERFLQQLPAAALGELQPLYEHFTSGMVRLDPPEHTRIRSLTNKAFTPRVVESLRRRIEDLVNELIDAFQARGRCDLISEFAYPLPAQLFAGLIGFPLKDCDRFKEWSVQIAAFHGTGRADARIATESQHALLEARRWLSELVDERRLRPRDDLLTRLVQAEEEGERLSESEMFSTCVTFMIGGHETTTNLIGNGLLALLQHPDQRSLIQQNLNSVASAVEELLRYDAPTQRAHRIAAADIQLRGKTIRKGDFVQAVLGAANRDPERFSNPDQLDILRQNNQHVSFGGGPHYCVGAPLSRLEAQIAITTLFRRLSNLRLAPDALPEISANNFFRGWTKIPLAFDPSSSSSRALTETWD